MSKIQFIKCSHCGADNDNTLSYCSKCGSPLEEQTADSRSGRRIALYILLVLLIGAVLYAYVNRQRMEPVYQDSRLSADEKKKYENRLRELEARLRDARKKLSAISENDESVNLEIPDIPVSDLKANEYAVSGWTMIFDPWGRQIRKFRAGMSRHGWLALPARACLGGSKWSFYPDSGGELNLSGGLWIGGDKVGLWQVSGTAGFPDVSEIRSWNENEPVSWKSIESDSENDLMSLRAGTARGFFISVALPDDINEAGVFIQNGGIVGWTFGDWLAEGYMWPGSSGEVLTYNTWIRYFYDMTFAHGREEKFAMALSLNDSNDTLDQLTAFVEGFRLQPRLTIDDTPEHLLTEEVIKKMRVLITRAVRSGAGDKVIDIFTGRVLKDIKNIYLLIDIIRVVSDIRGFEAAIAEIEDSGLYIQRQQGADVPALDKLHLQYYQEWMHDLVVDAEIDKGWQVFNSAKSFFNEDPYIHLMGVELALLDLDWQEAERLLYMMEYPVSYQDRVQLLALRISEMKGEEGKIVINFPPGSSRVTVDASVNGSVTQNFLVDTGATIVTITSATASALGLRVGPANYTLSTVGGNVQAAAVVIDSLEIDGWVEYDVRAFVVDIPNRPGLGLLGLNYLGRFRMDLKTDEGSLQLTPR